MTDFVIDTSAAVELFGGREPDSDLRRTVLTGRGVAPELFDIEALSTLRRIVRTGALSTDEGSAVLQRVRVAPITRTTHRPLLSRIWELRDTLTAYDAAYVALAEQLAVPLLTCDARLGRAHGHRAEVVVYPRS
jgi:predicted nucleic acid-binding protein